MNVKGTVIKYGDNIDTDVIIPARYLNTSDPKELASHCMEDIDTEFVKKVKKGEKIGYGMTYVAPSDQYIATLPIGYADGFIRANQGRQVYINGRYYPIVGRVCMDQMMVCVDENVHVHDEVEIFGEHMTLSRMAKELNTISYEITCLLSERVERVYIK